MGGLRPIGSEKLEGMDKIRRIMEIATYNENIPNPVNENKNTEYSLSLADGNVYAIVKERQGYIIKTAMNENVTEYIEPIRERRYYRSYSEALKRLNLMSKELNTLHGNKKGTSLFEEDEKKKDKKYVLKVGSGEKQQEPTTPTTTDVTTPAVSGATTPTTATPTTTTPTTATPVAGELGEQAPTPVDPVTQVPVPANPTAQTPVPADPTAIPADSTTMTGEIPTDDTDVSGEVPTDDMDVSDEDETDEKGKKEEVTFKTIQKLTGRLTQKIRKYTEEEEMTSDDTKYIINSILSSLDLESLDDEDVDEIIDRLEGEESEDDEVSDEEMGSEEMGGTPGEMPEPGLEGVPTPPTETTPEPELGEGYDNLSDAFSEKFKGAFTAGVANEMMEDSDNYPKHGAAAKRHQHLKHGTFGESKVDKIIASYFNVNENEVLIKEEERKRNIEINTKKIKNLSESVQQQKTSLRFIEKFPKSKLVGKTTNGNLIFQNKNNTYRISTDGKLI